MSFNLTRKTDYALVALAVLADPQHPVGRTLSARQIAEQYTLPTALLMNVLKDLHRAGIVCSRRGAGGGYQLAHHPSQINLLQIIEVIEGPVKVARCCDEEELSNEPCVSCSVEENCPIANPMQQINELIHQFLQRLTLADLLSDPKRVALTQTGIHA